MNIVTLQKPGPLTAKEFNANLENALQALKGHLSASTRLSGYSSKGWARIDITGEDAEIVSELVAREFGKAQTNITKLDDQGVYEGIIAGPVREGLEVDIGVDTPKPVNVKIRLEPLRTQLADGKSVHANDIIRDYCLFPGGKLSVRLTRLEPASGTIEGWLSDSQLKLFSSWIGLNLDRIQIPDCFRNQAETAVRKSGIERDIVAIEPVTLTTQYVLCKLGTDAVGLIPKLGSVLERHQLNPFIPRRILTRCRPW